MSQITSPVIWLDNPSPGQCLMAPTLRLPFVHVVSLSTSSPFPHRLPVSTEPFSVLDLGSSPTERACPVTEGSWTVEISVLAQPRLCCKSSYTLQPLINQPACSVDPLLFNRSFIFTINFPNSYSLALHN